MGGRMSPEKRRAYYEANADALRAKQREYRRRNLDKIKAYRVENADAIREYQREYTKAWRARNRAKVKADKKRYYAENREAIKASVRRWQEENHERYRAWHRLNARLRLLGRDWLGFEYGEVLRVDPCSYCGQRSDPTVDHIQAVVVGGSNDWTNLTAACRSCNSLKNARPLLHFLLERTT